MPESRDRISRPVDIAALFARRRTGGFGILIDQDEDLFRSPIRPQPQQQQQQQQQTTAVVRTPAGFGGSASRRGGGMGSVTPRMGSFRGRYSNENAVGRRGRGRSGVLPSWYPRTPLRDITAIARAIERRRARLRDGEGQDSESPSQDQVNLDQSISDLIIPLEHETYALSPRTAIKSKALPLSVGKVPKILLGIANQKAEKESDSLMTPQRKLLNSIDTVEKVVTEELQKLKRTPAAKKAERERRVRTLMSIR